MHMSNEKARLCSMQSGFCFNTAKASLTQIDFGFIMAEMWRINELG